MWRRLNMKNIDALTMAQIVLGGFEPAEDCHPLCGKLQDTEGPINVFQHR